MHPQMYHCNAAPGSTRSGRLPTPPYCYLSTVAYIVAALPPSLFLLSSDDRGLATSVPAFGWSGSATPHTYALTTPYIQHTSRPPLGPSSAQPAVRLHAVSVRQCAVR
eukprot:5654685-Pleurochrysis_carterae.AAC.1